MLRGGDTKLFLIPTDRRDKPNKTTLLLQEIIITKDTHINQDITYHNVRFLISPGVTLSFNGESELYNVQFAFADDTLYQPGKVVFYGVVDGIWDTSGDGAVVQYTVPQVDVVHASEVQITVDDYDVVVAQEVRVIGDDPSV